VLSATLSQCYHTTERSTLKHYAAGYLRKLKKLIKHADIVIFIKSRRIAWLGHVMWMDDKRTSNKRILQWKPIGARIRGRPRKRWIEDIENICK
jgi:hypothetical protein